MGCSNYKDNPCKYFKWVDEIVSESSAEQLKIEKKKNKELKKIVEDEQKKNRELKRKCKVLEFKVKFLIVLVFSLVAFVFCKM